MNDKRQTCTESSLEHSRVQNYWLGRRKRQVWKELQRKATPRDSEGRLTNKTIANAEKQRSFLLQSDYSIPINDQLDVLNIDADILMEKRFFGKLTRRIDEIRV
ncbi:hypothetical protein M513_04588 [Trichuris suis]|uniref:Uncharacterized protein n=1 Tax=Trichuris suis TaxID=68888 RepID=A0A085MB45_9BILA|nr:hypothetical protein M513_04588 [Trichuris suis]